MALFTATPRQTHYGHLVMIFGFFIAMFSVILQGVGSPKTIAFGTSEIIGLSNQYRTNASLSALITNQTLTNSAQSKAEHMAANSYFAHDAPDGTSPWDFFAAQGYAYTSAGENLALTNQSASSVVDGWYNSPGHRANMMSATFTEVGYGIAFVPSFTYNDVVYSDVYLVAAHYAVPLYTPAPAPTPPPVVTESLPVQQVVEPTPQTQTTENIDPSPQEPIAAGQDDQINVAPTGFSPEPPNSSRSGEYANIKQEPVTTLSQPITMAGIGTGGAFVVFGSTVEIRRLLKHQSLLPRLHK